MSNYNSELQSNNTILERIMNKIDSLPDKGTDLPELTNPGIESDILEGKELIDQEGNKITGSFTLQNELTSQDELIAQIKTAIQGKAGGSLNFSVKAYPTEEALLADTPEENTIGVITENEITDWYFSAEQNDSMIDGEIWISTGTSSSAPLNVFKNNKSKIYPIKAKQMINGALVDVTAKIYQNEKWNSFIPYLFPSEEVSWKASATSSRGTVIIGSTIEFNYTNADSAYVVATTVNSQNLGEYTTLYFDMVLRGHYNNYGGGAKVGVTKTAGITGNNVNQFSASVSPTADGVRRIVAVNISNVSSGFITIHGILKATVYAVWAE